MIVGYIDTRKKEENEVRAGLDQGGQAEFHKSFARVAIFNFSVQCN